MNSGYETFKSQFKGDYNKEISEKLREAEDWVKSLHEKLKNKDYQQANNLSITEKLLACLGYFSLIRDKLKDEIVFNKDSLRSLNLQVRRVEKEIESKRSDLEVQVEVRDSARKEFESLKEKREGYDRSLPDYLDIEEAYHNSKKRKEVAESAAKKTAMIYQNLSQSVELMKVSSEQSKISIREGSEVLDRVEKAIDEINVVYHQVMIVMSNKKKILQIAGGEDESKK
ncbi:hypothetical protein FJZ53_02570 [Candidatus Woesearchaeota archaeon]|nr:hypothetical protein [Candidatus Woesearchaeota archaeon]